MTPNQPSSREELVRELDAIEGAVTWSGGPEARKAAILAAVDAHVDRVIGPNSAPHTPDCLAREVDELYACTCGADEINRLLVQQRQRAGLTDSRGGGDE